MKLVKVTQETFYQYVGSRDITVTSKRDHTVFRTRTGTIVGQTAGYVPDETYYSLTEAAIKELTKK